MCLVHTVKQENLLTLFRIDNFFNNQWINSISSKSRTSQRTNQRQNGLVHKVSK